MATVLDKVLKRQVSVDGMDYVLAVDSDGLRLTRKGKRRSELELRWHDLLSGDAAMAVALNASLSPQLTSHRAKSEEGAGRGTKRTAPKKQASGPDR